MSVKVRFSLLSITFICVVFLNAYSQKKSGPKTQIRTITTLDDAELIENSGMIFYKGYVWFQSDGGADAAIYAFDTASAKIVRTIKVKNAINHDWEDITQDNDYIYIGDFGNNNGDRKNLQILRLSKKDIENTDEVKADVIQFSYADQLDFSKRRGGHNFDCEALVKIGDSLFVFTKNWADYQTRMYGMPATPGVYSLHPIATFDMGGLVTGAAFDAKNGILMLVAYRFDNKVFIPYLMASKIKLSSQLKSMTFKKLTINKEFHQMEAITDTPWGGFLFSNEAIYKKYISVPAKLFEIRMYE